MRTCKRCKQEKSDDQFGIDRSRKDKTRPYCRDCTAEAHAAYQRSNREKLNQYVYTRLKTNKSAKIAHAFRTFLNKIIRNKKSGKYWIPSTMALANRTQLMDYLVSTIPSGYSLAEYGRLLCVDHIKPCSSFDLTDETQRAECFHYTNLRLIPIWQNQSKGCKLAA